MRRRIEVVADEARRIEVQQQPLDELVEILVVTATVRQP